MEIDNDLPSCVQARFKSDTGEETGSPLDLPLNINKDQLTLICNSLLKEVWNVKKYNYIPMHFTEIINIKKKYSNCYEN